MKIGVPKEIKNQEYRVALTPAGTAALVQLGHTIWLEFGAGIDAGFTNDDYRKAGAQLVTQIEAWNCDLVLKVKEPLESEYTFLKNQILFTYLHLAGASLNLTTALLLGGTTALAYETLEDTRGRLPLLAPMSAVAGSMAVTVGNYYLARFNHGKGELLGTILGKTYGKVVIIGDGIVGQHAAKAATGMGAQVFIAGRHAEHAALLKQSISDRLHFFLSTQDAITDHLEDTDLLIGAVLVHGAKAPYVVSEEMVKRMPRGSVIVDVSIDQGGCIETSSPTSHSDPVFEKHGVTHYCVTNMPGAYPRTSTQALTAATLPYVLRLADEGIETLRHDTGLAKALNTYKGHITCKPVAEALGLMDRYRPFGELG